MCRMIEYAQGNRHDIDHFLKVYAYAATIAQCEGLSPRERETVEIAAIVHDIACPLCREKYGNTNGKYQEREGTVLAEEFLSATDLPQAVKERVVYLVGHHHTLTGIDGIDYQILIEADYLVNASEMNHSESQIQSALQTVFKTKTGTALLQAVYGTAGAPGRADPQ